MNLRIEGINALVCGGSKGIGLGIAERYAKMGANVAILSRNENNLKEALGRLNDISSAQHEYIAADASDPEGASAKVQEMAASMGAFHILVNNTGGPAYGFLQNSSAKQLMAAYTQHVILSQTLTLALIPAMKEAQFGRIINVISMGAKTPITGLGVSNTIRGAMTGWSKTLSNELAPFGITVNNLLPGNIYTGRLETLINKRAETAGKSTKEIIAEMTSDIPAGKFGTPEDMGLAAGFFASREAAYFTGVSLQVDGGKIPCV